MYNKIYPYNLRQNLSVRVRRTGQTAVMKQAVSVDGRYLLVIEFDGGDRAEVWIDELALVEVKP